MGKSTKTFAVLSVSSAITLITQKTWKKKPLGKSTTCLAVITASFLNAVLQSLLNLSDTNVRCSILKKDLWSIQFFKVRSISLNGPHKRSNSWCN